MRVPSNRKAEILNRRVGAIEGAGASKPISESPDRAGARLADLMLESLENSQAEEIVCIDVNDQSALADYMLIASGRAHRHVGAVTDRLLRDLKNAGCGAPKVEGVPARDWVLIDAGDVIVHIFRPPVREFYDLEKIWSPEYEPETDTDAPEYAPESAREDARKDARESAPGDTPEKGDF